MFLGYKGAACFFQGTVSRTLLTMGSKGFLSCDFHSTSKGCLCIGENLE